MLALGLHHNAVADAKYHPVQFALRTEKESYYEGEKITLLITISNTDKENAYPVLLPHTQNVGQKLFCLSAYDKAPNTCILRYSEDPIFNIMVQDTGTVQIKYLKPLEQIIVPIYLNDTHKPTQDAAQHSFGVPLFAGIYKIRVHYRPGGIPLGESLYNYYNDTDTELPDNGKMAMPGDGLLSNFCSLSIKRSKDSLVRIEGVPYFIKTNGYNYFYFTKPVENINTSDACVHISTLPPDSASIKNEYYYNQFDKLYNEFIARFEDGDIKEYRKFTNWCPEYLYTERFNELKQRTHHEYQLPDGRFYSASYNQPAGTLHQETYCSADGTLCTVTSYVYDKKGELLKKVVTQTEPCSVVIIDGKKRSAKRVVQLEGR